MPQNQVEKVASDASVDALEEDTVTKIAEDLFAAGEIFGNSAANAMLEKFAGSGVPAAGGGSNNPIDNPRSKWEAVAARIAMAKGRSMSPGDDTSVRAEQDGALHGDSGFSNTARPLG